MKPFRKIHILTYNGNQFYFTDITKLQAAKDALKGSEFEKSQDVDMTPAKIRKAK